MDISLVTVLVTIAIFLFLLSMLKSVVKAGIGILAFIILFRVGWVYTSDDLKEKLHLDSFISEEYQDDFFNKYDDYTNRREENKMVDTDNIDNTINNHLDILDKKVDDFITNKSQKE